MKKILFMLLISTSLFAQQHYVFPYQDPNLTPEQRAKDIVSRMTLEEKISQMVYNASAIERLGIPQYNWWNECLHGVARNGLATVFPQPIGLAATWDKNLIYKVGNAISDEARAKYNDAQSRGWRGIYQGLTFWSPNINIFRDPRWGRGMETYGEDPYLTGQMAVQFIKGLQGSDPKYLKVVATAKHYGIHSGPEPLRHKFDVNVTDYDLRETYLPAFKMSVQQGHVASIMCAYNSFRGSACCSSDPLLDMILRDEWGFKGYVVSDCWAISDIYEFHKQVKNAEEASAVAVNAGTDLECGNSYPKLFNAVRNGLTKESEIDTSLVRLFEARFKLGMFDSAAMVPYSKIKMNVVDSKENRELAGRTARESIVLLKNNNKILPLKKNLKTIAVIGPNANDEEVLLGNYNGIPSFTKTPLQGIIDKVGGHTKVIYERGCDVAENISSFEIIPSEFLFTSLDKKQHGLKREVFDNAEFKGKPYIETFDKKIDIRWLKDSADKIFEGGKSIRWSGYLIPSKSGSYKIGGYGGETFSIYLDDSLVAKLEDRHECAKDFKEVTLEANKPYRIKIDYLNPSGFVQLQLIWSAPDENGEDRAIAAAKNSDVTILCMGLSPRLEGEELPLHIKGFDGGDRETLDLPDTQENLIRKISALGKPVVLVLLNGSALSINWENETIPAIVESWYGGESAGSAIADVLFGDYNPAGRLPVTFYKSVNQLPDFTDYNMPSGNSSYLNGNITVTYKSKTLGRTYRYFEGEPLYPFGYGLSFTTFEYKNLRLSKDKIQNGESTKLFVDVKNTGKVSGDEVVQLYVRGSNFDTGGALESLKGFERISLKPNQTKTVEFDITPESLQEYFGDKGFVVNKGEHFLMIGPSSARSTLKEIKLIVE